MKTCCLALIALCMVSCNNITYRPRTKMQQVIAKPSPLIFDKIVEFRIEQTGWPISRADFISKGKKYEWAFKDFRYLSTKFKVTDSNRMTFYFSQYIQDIEREQRTKKADLNSYGGYVKFYRENDKFIWKLKMY